MGVGKVILTSRPGVARPPPTVRDAEGFSVIVCHCHVVNDAAIAEAVEAGARTLGQVCRATGAGRDCGACVFSVRRLVCEHDATPVPDAAEVCHAAS